MSTNATTFTQDVFTTRYVNAAAYVILLYDHVLTLGNEVDFIWSAKWTSAKALFLYVRYVVPCAITLYTVQLSGLSEVSLSDNLSLVDEFCPEAFVGWATVASSNFLILLRLWVIWDRNRKLMIWTLCCFIVAQIVGLAAACLLIWRMKPALVWNSTFKMCVFLYRVPVEILWVPGTVFEIILCGITWRNALNKARSSNVALTAAMYRDGLLYFLLLLCLRITNTVLAVAAPLSLNFIAMFPVLCATTTTTCHLVIKLRQIAENDQIVSDYGPCEDDASIAMQGEYDELERSGVRVEMLRSVGPSTPVRSSWYGR